jgi:hypothetical protein
MNNLGDIVGSHAFSATASRAFFFEDNTGLVDQGTMGGKVSSANAVNIDRFIVGDSDTSTKAGAPRKPFITRRNASWTWGLVDLKKLIRMDLSPAVPAGTTFRSPQYLTDSQLMLIDTDTVGPCILIPAPVP